MEINNTTPKQGVSRLIFFPIFSGVLMAQGIAALFVYLSNQRILDAAETIEKMGYFPIPSGQALASLKDLGSAMGGGLFFTLSIGIGLTLLTWAGCRMWLLLFKRDNRVLICYGTIWMGLIIWINLDGWVLFPSLFFLLVPVVTAWSTLSCRGNVQRESNKTWFFPLVTLIFLTAMWATQFNSHLFTTIRDHILLSNPAGRSINDFYYRYTLYAAESFKSFNQKTLRTCILEGFDDEGRRRRLAKRLLVRDVLAIPDIDHPDIRLTSTNTALLLISDRGETIETTFEEMLSDTNDWLSKFSHATDHHLKFRRMTLYGLLIGFPILLFVVCYGLICAALGLVLTQNKVVIAGSALCLIIGVLLFLPMLRARPVDVAKDGMANALASDQWPQRVAALRLSDSANIEIGLYPAYQKLVNSPLVVERYWLARALAKSRMPVTYGHLLSLLQDPHPNVVCQALYALGERRQRAAIGPIIQKLKNLDHWYAQWYGYKALRRLGWHQDLSK
jgi:hypothetical protein